MNQALKELKDLTDQQRKFLNRVERDRAFTEVFFFTGGTLLKALGIVPRYSNDLDFFTFPQVTDRDFLAAQFQARELLEDVFGQNAITNTDRGFLHGESGMIIDLVADGSRNIEKFKPFGKLQTASLKDLAAHKASALCSRDEVKDLIDIAFLTKGEKWLLRDLERFAESKFNLGTISEEKLLSELLARRETASIPPEIWLKSAEENIALVTRQIEFLIEHTSL